MLSVIKITNILYNITSRSHDRKLSAIVYEMLGHVERDVVHGRVNFLCDGSLDRSLMMDPLRCFLLQPVLHDWYNKSHGMCCRVCGMLHLKDLC